MECPRCGTQNDDTRQFCFTCGNPLASNMLEPIDFGKTQATPVVVTPIEPMTKEEELKNTSVIPVVSETVEAKPIEPDPLEEESEEETKRINAIREELAYTSEMEKVKVNIKQLESVKKPKKKKPTALIIVIVILFLICASGVSYYLFKKDMISFLKTTTTSTTTTTTEFKVDLDTELRATSDEVILNTNSHILKYSYEITKIDSSYKPVLKIYFDDNIVDEAIIQDNSYSKAKVAYDDLMNNDIYIIENQIVKGLDKDYYYINVLVNNKFYVFILNDTSVIYKNVTEMFETTDTASIYNNKSSLLKDGNYVYIKQVDEENSIEQVSSIENDVVTFTDGESVQGTWK